MHLFGHTFDHDYYFELPVQGSGIPNQLLGVQLHTLAISGLSRVRTELFQLLVIPSLAPHPIHANRQSPRHGDLGDLPPSLHRQVKVLTAPFRIATHCDLRRFHQQETQQRVALFRDVAPAVAAARSIPPTAPVPDSSRSACHTETDPPGR